jgi:hypothetical protein
LVKGLTGNTEESSWKLRLFGPASDPKSASNATAAYNALSSLSEEGLTGDNRVCVFKPAVQVLDNWGWCNGSCVGGNGCYNEVYLENSTKPADKCNPTFGKAWDYYKGSIIIIP